MIPALLLISLVLKYGSVNIYLREQLNLDYTMEKGPLNFIDCMVNVLLKMLCFNSPPIKLPCNLSTIKDITTKQ